MNMYNKKVFNREIFCKIDYYSNNIIVIIL